MDDCQKMPKNPLPKNALFPPSDSLSFLAVADCTEDASDELDDSLSNSPAPHPGVPLNHKS
jgi:hypothetical protein